MPHDDFDPFADPGRPGSAGRPSSPAPDPFGPSRGAASPLAGRLDDLRATMDRERREGLPRRRPLASLVALGLTLLATAGLAFAGWHGLAEAVPTRGVSVRTAAQVGTVSLLLVLAAAVLAVVGVVRERRRVLAGVVLALALLAPGAVFLAAVQLAVPLTRADLAAVGAGSVEAWWRSLGEGAPSDAVLVRLLEVLTR
ncbi:DUF389 domain-containing protein [Desertihabitans brevis]|uniref:DUF389 domain-containing protein n=1 Tax=Desertihabitans brevis TaxID=2268447 RepID=UPI0011BD7932|nr:DUF389 domain-containing protein [Desertihabitans brevis]